MTEKNTIDVNIIIGAIHTGALDFKTYFHWQILFSLSFVPSLTDAHVNH